MNLSTPNREVNVSLLGKDFAGFKRNLIKFSQAHHSGVFQDYNEVSPGMAMLELTAYIGDALSFYIDQNFAELRQESARETKNVYAIARQKGYTPAGKRAARGTQTFFIEVPAISSPDGMVPDDRYSPILRSAQLAGPGGVKFETLDQVAFSASNVDSPRMVTGSKFDSTTGLPTYFAIRKDVDIVAGETKVFSTNVGDFQQFLQLTLPDADVLEVISVVDGDNNEWFEVDYLAQDTVFDVITNENDDSDVVPYLMKLRTVPRRFIKDRDPTNSRTTLTFGSGDGVSYDDELIPNLADMALPLAGKRTFSSFALDPQNFLKTRSLGLSPFNTSLTINYRIGGGSQTNVPAKSVKSINNSVLDFTSTNLDPIAKSKVISSLQTMNMDKTDGGGPEETVSEIKANSDAYFATQNRIVTREDVIVRVLSLPSKFGKVYKTYVNRNNLNSQAFDIHVLTQDPDGHLNQATPTLIQNLVTYLGKYRMLTDSINILQTDIINLGVNFGVVVAPKLNKSQVLTKCLKVVVDYFDTDRWQIRQPIFVTDLQSQLQNVDGVVSVYKLEFRNIVGTDPMGFDYSLRRFDVSAANSNQILYCPDNSMFEVKYPTRDVIGEAK